MYKMTEIRKGRRVEPTQDERFIDSLNELHSGCNGCVNIGCVVPSIIIAIILFLGLFGNKEYVTGIKENTRTAKICFVFKRKMTKGSNNNSGDSNTAPEEDDVVVVEEVAVDTTAAVVESSEVEIMPVQ